MVGVRDAAVLQSKTIELNGQILSAQQSALAANTAQSALLSEISTLKEKVADLESWETEKQNYELFEFRPGALAYRFKVSVDPAKPAHEICANCYEGGIKSILQHETIPIGRKHIARCNSCHAVIYVSGNPDGPPRQPVKMKRLGGR